MHCRRRRTRSSGASTRSRRRRSGRAAQGARVVITGRDQATLDQAKGQLGTAHVSGDRSVALLDKTIPQLFSDTASKYATQDAAVFVGQDKRFTWSELSDTVDALAAGFLALGLEKGDRVGIW